MPIFVVFRVPGVLDEFTRVRDVPALAALAPKPVASPQESASATKRLRKAAAKMTGMHHAGEKGAGGLRKAKEELSVAVAHASAYGSKNTEEEADPMASSPDPVPPPPAPVVAPPPPAPAPPPPVAVLPPAPVTALAPAPPTPVPPVQYVETPTRMPAAPLSPQTPELFQGLSPEELGYATTIAEWFKAKGYPSLARCAPALVRDGYDTVGSLLELDADAIAQLDGLKRGHRKQLAKLAAELCQEASGGPK